ncbi:MAG: FkbM family methyltransferase [Thermodesulfovibrionales bacterium]
MKNLKATIYKTGINCLRMFWRVRGGRTIKAFDEKYHVTADTVFPDYRKFKLPKKGCLSEIVRYTDYVQLHSVVNYVMQLKNQPTIIDIGAHHGAYAVILGKIIQKKGGRVIAVEPNPQSFDVLKENVLLNKLENTVVCEQFAIADKTGLMNIDLAGSESKLTQEQTDRCCTVEVNTIAFRSHIPMRKVLALPDFRNFILPLLTPDDQQNLIVNTRGFDTWGGQIRKEDMLGLMRLALPPLIKYRPCNWTLSGLYVTWEGQVRACACRFAETPNKDGKDELYVGNIMESSLSEIWYGEEIKRLRRRFQDGNLPLVCKNCTMYRSC